MEPALVRDIINQQNTQFQNVFVQVQQQNATLTQMLQNVTQQQEQQAAAADARRHGGGLPREMDELRAVINPKILEKCPVFSGKNGDFVEWTFTFGSITGLLGLEDGMRIAIDVAEDAEVALMRLDEETRLKSKALWFLLINSCKGKGLIVIKTTERHNALLAWRKLHPEYQPKLGGRFNAMLMALLTPMWAQQKTPFDELLIQWETDVQEYERQSGDDITAIFKIAVITRHAPADYQNLVTSASSDAGQDYEKFRMKILTTLHSGITFSGTGVVALIMAPTPWTSAAWAQRARASADGATSQVTS